MSIQDSDKQINMNKPNPTYPIDLGSKIAMVKPTYNKGGTVPQPTFRTISQPQMRVVVPAGSVSGASGSAQIIQTHLMPQGMIKHVDMTGRTQITALPSRTLTQASITVARPPANTFLPRGPTALSNIGGQRGATGTPTRTSTPPSALANLTSNFVRASIPPRTPSPAGTVLSPGTSTWVTATPSVQLVRTGLNQGPRGRLVTQTVPGNVVSSSTPGITTLSANLVTQSSSQPNTIQTVTSQTGQQTYVATLAAVLPSRPQTATLVYSNPQQFGQAQRFTTRGARPIQLGTARMPTGGINVRVSSSTLSIRGPNMPVLTPTNVLTSIPSTQSRATAVSASNISTTGLPTTRIIQVQQPQAGGTGGQQVISAGRIGNLMTLHPVIMNATTGNVRAQNTSKVQPSLTITHVGKLTSATNTTGQTISAATLPQGAQLATATGHQGQQQTQIASQQLSTSTPIGIVTGGTLTGQTAQQIVQQQQNQQHHVQPQHQIAQIVGSHGGHQIIIGTQNAPVSATVVPLSINRTTNSLPSTITTSAPMTQIVRNMNVPMSTINAAATNISNATVLPIAKVVPQSVHETTATSIPISSIPAQNVFIQTRSSNPGGISSSTTGGTGSNIVTTGSTSFISAPTGTTFYYEQTPVSSVGAPIVQPSGVSTVLTLTTTTTIANSNSSNSTSMSHPNIIPGQLVTSVPYAPQAGSFAAVSTSNRNQSQTINQIHGVIPVSNANQTGQMPSMPIRFNPQLIVDASQIHAQNQSAGHTHQIVTVQQGTGNLVTINQPPQLVQHQQQLQQHQQHQSLLPQPQHQQPQQQLQQQQLQQQQPQQQIVSSQPQQQQQLTHQMLIPVQSKPTVPRANVARKREVDNFNFPKSAAKNLNPTLMSMTTPTHKEKEQQCRDRVPSPHSRPGSSGGSTTVSVTSSPGAEQDHDELDAMLKLRMSDTFKPVDDIFPQSSGRQQPTAGRNGHDEPIPRKKVKRSYNKHNSGAHLKQGEMQISQQPAQAPPPPPPPPPVLPPLAIHSHDGLTNKLAANNVIQNNNKENSKPTEIYIKKPRTCTLLEGYKQNWKAANNHFQRYSDVKPREERRSTVIDLANQAYVAQKVNGWKIFHLSSQMEEMVELESQVYEKLSSILKSMEKYNQSTDIDRVNDLIKGNMQRSKIVSDGIQDGRAQIMKIFEHKAPVADIIHRCASKRNFKKREKA